MLQYTGLPEVGLNGTSVSWPHEEQVADLQRQIEEERQGRLKAEGERDAEAAKCREAVQVGAKRSLENWSLRMNAEILTGNLQRARQELAAARATNAELVGELEVQDGRIAELQDANSTLRELTLGVGAAGLLVGAFIASPKRIA